MSKVFDAEIFDSLKEDTTGLIRRTIGRHASSRKRVMDLGCGVGRYLPYLAGVFGRVDATDWAPRCVAVARRIAAPLPNVTVELPPFYNGRSWTGRFDVVVAINVLVDPNRRRRQRLLGDVRRLLKKGGAAILLVPSLESIVYADAIRRAYAPAQRSLYRFGGEAARRDPGLLEIQEVLYKHFVSDELTDVLLGAGFLPDTPERVCYRWQTEAASPPPSRRRLLPAPWDWLVVARRA